MIGPDMKQMPALRFEPGRGLSLCQVDVPRPRAGEVLIEVAAAGLCGTDVAVLKGHRVPRRTVTLGHEIAGTVREVGSEVGSERVGRDVVITSIVMCGHCRACLSGAENLCPAREVIGIERDGGLAQFVVAPAKNAIDLPPGVPPEIGALAVDAVATPYHALKERARLLPGENAVILGIGGLGQHAVQLAAMMTSAQVIAVDIRREQLDLALRVGATAAVHPDDGPLAEQLVEAAGGQVDVILDCAGVGQILDTALPAVRPGGRAVRVALEHSPLEITDPVSWVRTELALIGSYGFTRAEVSEVLGFIADGRLRLDESVSHRVQLGDVGRVLEEMGAGAAGYRRVVVDVPGSLRQSS